mmetsp:Transcript_41619/g.82119  ORF Transcript_41619/g.82119 Transcript_41619/m.82119 type:complete len:86 (+) Transcript_41619:118-375(+)
MIYSYHFKIGRERVSLPEGRSKWTGRLLKRGGNGVKGVEDESDHDRANRAGSLDSIEALAKDTEEGRGTQEKGSQTPKKEIIAAD